MTSRPGALVTAVLALAVSAVGCTADDGPSAGERSPAGRNWNGSSALVELDVEPRHPQPGDRFVITFPKGSPVDGTYILVEGDQPRFLLHAGTSENEPSADAIGGDAFDTGSGLRWEQAPDRTSLEFALPSEATAEQYSLCPSDPSPCVRIEPAQS